MMLNLMLTLIVIVDVDFDFVDVECDVDFDVADCVGAVAFDVDFYAAGFDVDDVGASDVADVGKFDFDVVDVVDCRC